MSWKWSMKMRLIEAAPTAPMIGTACATVFSVTWTENLSATRTISFTSAGASLPAMAAPPLPR